jgi:hypothetical protein
MTEQKMTTAQIEKELESQAIEIEQKNLILYLIQKKVYEQHQIEQEKKINQKKIRIFLILILIALPSGYLISQISIPERYMIYASSRVIYGSVLIIGTVMTALLTGLAKR